jgi:acylglycerol lipase
MINVRSIPAAVFLLLSLQACVSFPDAPASVVEPALEDNALRSIDGELLALQSWRAENPRAVIIALHGMNDYSNAFSGPGAWWAEQAGITTYAIDQRGFGRSPNFKRWAGHPTMIADLRAAVSAVREEHPGLPLYVLGHSMGAAVVMAAEEQTSLGAEGLILAAPGVWSVPFPVRVLTNIAASVAPGKTLTGERAERQATDNIDVLREMMRDPQVIKETRLDAILGVVRVMGDANDDANDITTDVLFLIGNKDEIIPLKSLNKTAGKLRGNVDIRRYDNGWHLLFRDLQREVVWRDVAEWIISREEGEPLF